MRRRLVVAIAAVAGAAVILFAVPLGIVLQRGYRDEDLLRLQRDTIAAARGIDLSGWWSPCRCSSASESPAPCAPSALT